MTKINSTNQSFPLTESEGGTNVSSFSTTNGILKFDGTNVVTSSTAKINSNDQYTNTSQPAFFAYKSSTTNNVTGNANFYNFICDTEIFDQSNSYDNTTGVFTAPAQGIYEFGATVYSSNTTNSATEIRIKLVCDSGVSYFAQTRRNSTNFPFYHQVRTELVLPVGGIIYPSFYIYGGGGSVYNCYGHATEIWTSFWGRKIA